VKRTLPRKLPIKSIKNELEITKPNFSNKIEYKVIHKIVIDTFLMESFEISGHELNIRAFLSNIAV
jgi:hypothetical protein